jgi:putative flippase GtrA
MIELASFYIFNQIIGVNYIIATLVAFIFSASTNYVLQKKFTFKNNYSKKHIQFAVFLMITVGGIAINTSVTIALVETLKLWPPFAKIFAILAATIYNYFMNKKITFGKLK